MKGSTEFERPGHDELLVIGEMPGRQRPVLAVRKGNVTRSLASFRDDDAARDAIAVIKAICNARPEAPVDADPVASGTDNDALEG